MRFRGEPSLNLPLGVSRNPESNPQLEPGPGTFVRFLNAVEIFIIAKLRLSLLLSSSRTGGPDTGLFC